jgi:beta-lactamase superfamily II metal-dependent hydrolase
MAEVIVLDVGHGNSAIIRSQDNVAVVDSPTGSALLDALCDLGIKSVDAAFVSHTDKDHLAGILALLTSVEVHVSHIYINPDADKQSELWRDFRVAVSDAEARGTCTVHTSLSTTAPGAVEIGEARVIVAAPSASLALTGVGGTTNDNKAVNANTMSAVLKVETVEGQGVLLTGDMDEVGLDEVMKLGRSLQSNVLVFPHHGGLPGSSNASDFASKLIDAVQPSSVIFSNGRNQHDNPRPEIVRVMVDKGVRVACTQLSKRCSPNDLAADLLHLEPHYARGRRSFACCAGTMSIQLNEGAKRVADHESDHDAFVLSQLPTPMCKLST